MIFDLIAAAAEIPDSTGNPIVDLGNTLQHKFGLKPSLLIAQCINFVIVAFVLKKFAFGPIGKMLAERHERIAEGERKLEQIEKDLADSEKKTAEAIAAANDKAKQLVAEAQESAAIMSEEKAQEAIASAQSILNKAEQAAKAEREEMVKDLKSDFGRLVATATQTVTGKVLNDSDRQTINEDALTIIEK